MAGCGWIVYPCCRLWLEGAEYDCRGMRLAMWAFLVSSTCRRWVYRHFVCRQPTCLRCYSDRVARYGRDGGYGLFRWDEAISRRKRALRERRGHGAPLIPSVPEFSMLTVLTSGSISMVRPVSPLAVCWVSVSMIWSVLLSMVWSMSPIRSATVLIARSMVQRVAAHRLWAVQFVSREVSAQERCGWNLAQRRLAHAGPKGKRMQEVWVQRKPA